MESIGFIGLGKMGRAMAGNLLKAGFTLQVYNRTPEKASALVAQGARLVHQPGDAAESGGIVITMLANDRAWNGYLPGLMLANEIVTDSPGLIFSALESCPIFSEMFASSWP